MPTSRRRACPPAAWPASREGEQGWFPRSPDDRSSSEVPNWCPGSIATPTPQTFSVASSPANLTGNGVAHPAGRALHPGPYPPGLGPVLRLRSVVAGSPLLHLPDSLAGPGPSGSAVPSRRCQGCSHPHPRPRARAAPSFTGLLRQPSGGVLSPPLGHWRLVAHRLVKEDQPGRLYARPFLIRGHSCATQCWIACSSRCLA
jgi:hypothetical protein